MFKIISTGMYLPKNLVTNEDLCKKFGDDPLKKILGRIGHGARYYSDKDESSAHLAIKAGEEALKKLGDNPIDLILLDVMMPGMDGFEVTRRVRQDEKTRLLPIILVTALRETEDRGDAFAIGLQLDLDRLQQTHQRDGQQTLCGRGRS